MATRKRDAPTANPLTRLQWTAFTAWHLRRESSLPFWPIDRVRALQSRRVRRIVSFAWREVPCYREAMLAAGQPTSPRDRTELPATRRRQSSGRVGSAGLARDRSAKKVRKIRAGGATP